MDENFLERADELTTLKINDGIAASRVREPKPVNFVGECECGESIPEPRIRLGYYRCVSCQTAIEQRRRFFSK